jgi:molybdopterin-guanine dinucleotide biosynthesis protein A
VDAQDALTRPGRGAVAAAIVAGGEAARLGGRPKGLLVVGGRRIVDRQLEALAAVFARAFVVANDPAPWQALGLGVVGDRVPRGRGPLAGLDAALAALRPGEDAVVCVAGDMPFLSVPALRLLRDTDPEADALVPAIGGHAEPLFARYGRGCAGPVARALAAGRFKTTSFLEEVRAVFLDEAALRALDPDLRSLVNVNTPGELERAEAMARAGAGG